MPRRTRIAAALLYGGRHAVLSHRTAAEEWGMLPLDDAGPVHVTVPYGSSAISQPSLVEVHRTRAMPFIAVGTDPARTTRVDTIIDLAAAETLSGKAQDRFVQLAGPAPISLARLGEQLDVRPPRRHRKSIRRGLELLAGGAVSVLEAEYVRRVESAHGIPTGDRQVPFTVDDRTLWEDITYDSCGVPLTVRLDGRAYHSAPGVAFRDRRRDNAAELADRCRLVYGWKEVRSEPCGVAAEVFRVLSREGWTGRREQCGECRS